MLPTYSYILPIFVQSNWICSHTHTYIYIYIYLVCMCIYIYYSLYFPIFPICCPYLSIETADSLGHCLLGHSVLGSVDGHFSGRESQFDHRHLRVRAAADHHSVAHPWDLHLSQHEAGIQWHLHPDTRSGWWPLVAPQTSGAFFVVPKISFFFS